MATKCWMASLNFALITKNGVLLASQRVFRRTPLVTNNAKVVNLRAMQTGMGGL